MKKILIIEDEKAYLKLLYDELVQNGYQVIYAQDGISGLKLALTEKPDLILLDIILPKLDGLKILKALRQDPWGKDVTVFILTNVNQSPEISTAMNNNANNFIIKSEVKLVICFGPLS